MAVVAKIEITIAINITGGPGNSRDFVGLFRCADPDSRYLDWLYLHGTRVRRTTGVTSGRVSFVCPAAPGSYELRYLGVAQGVTDGSYTRLAKSGPVTIAAAAAEPGPAGEAIVTETQEPIVDQTGAPLVTAAA